MTQSGFDVKISLSCTLWQLWLPLGVQFFAVRAVYMKGGGEGAMTEEEKTILLTRHDGLLQRQEGRIKELERRQDDLDKMASCVAKLAQRQQDMDADVKEIKRDVSQMAQKAGRRWEMIVEKAIAAIVGALFGFVLLKLGLG